MESGEVNETHSLRAAGIRAIAVPFVYAIFGMIWILASDLFLASLDLSREWTTRVAMAKGWIFVGGTTILLSVVLRTAWRSLERAFQALRQELAQRRQAQEESARWALELENRVRERTSHLEAALQDLGMFTDSVSHDLRAPVRAVGGFSRILLEDHAETMGDQAQGLLRRVADSAARMDRMIDGLLGLARCGRDSMLVRRISASEHQAMVDGLWGEIQAAAPDRGLVFLRGPLSPVQADPRFLETLWRNLLANAAKYTRESPSPKVEVGCAEGWFEIKDNGAGFDQEKARDIFRPFRRLHRSDEFEGEGIGLALVRKIVDRHGGEVEAVGEVGRGARIRFRIPDSLGS
jgi:signal transduction histidine kinase